MRSCFLTLAALLAVSCFAQSASANGGLGLFRQRHIERQVIVQKQVVVAQPVVVQRFVQRQVYAQPIVQQVYAQPVVAAYSQAVVAPACAQQFSQSYRQQIGIGCQSFFAH